MSAKLHYLSKIRFCRYNDTKYLNLLHKGINVVNITSEFLSPLISYKTLETIILILLFVKLTNARIQSDKTKPYFIFDNIFDHFKMSFKKWLYFLY